ncbi:MAG: UTP--glucose-phosphate uridylyltransferase [Chloroflexota bacterium]|jgi:UTP--glucose-1-phosphate uridylyltransferase|nr:UTP--glucose-phosphate uridylyltransferase [Chloroflexota bacterium]
MEGSSIRKAVIPAAGLGTRFLPGTKVLPKEILPVVDRPVIEWAVEEAADSGVEEVVMILSPGKDLLMRHFEPAPELERYLHERDKPEALEKVRAIGNGIRVSQVLQQEPLGLGHAVLQAREAIGDEYFAGLLPDDIIRGARPVIAQMIEVHQRLGCTVLAVRRVPIETIGRYGSIEVGSHEGRVYEVKHVVEKPDPRDAPSDLAVMGRYILSPRIFAALERTEEGAGGEIQLTDGIRNLIGEEKVVALEFEGDYFDVGTIPGWIKTSIALGRAREEFRDDLDAYIRELLQHPPDRPPATG